MGERAMPVFLMSKVQGVWLPIGLHGANIYLSNCSVTSSTISRHFLKRAGGILTAPANALGIVSFCGFPVSTPGEAHLSHRNTIPGSHSSDWLMTCTSATKHFSTMGICGCTDRVCHVHALLMDS